MPYGWNFQGVIGGKVNGINESGMEIFKGNPYKSLAREVCQNSLDARNDPNKPVIVEFQTFEMNANFFLDRDNFREALLSIGDFYRERPIRKVTDFLNRANAILQNDSIKCLRISDFNTVGLIGSSEKENHFTAWSNLVKSSGVSDKGDTEGGSFGIGKSAPFACSELRTVFYSTIDIMETHASQGVARLISFKKADGSIAIGEGYYCDTSTNAPVYDLTEFDESYTRSECGTDIYVIGFENDEKWADEVIKSIIDGFMLAVIEKHLVVRVGAEIISDETIASYIEKYGVDLPYAKNYYEVFTSPQAHVFKGSPVEYHDDVELRVLIRRGLHSKVAYFRNSGMKIHDRGYVSQFIPFAAVLVLRGSKINKSFKDMESVSHDKWEPNRIDGANARRRAEINLRTLYGFVKSTICALETDINADEIDAEGVGEYLPDDVNIEEQKRPEDMREAVTDKTKSFEVDVVIKTPKTGGVQGEDELSGNMEDNTFGEADENLDEDNSRSPQGPTNTTSGGIGTPAHLKENPDASLEMRKLVRVKPIYVRLFCVDKQIGKYMLTFVPDRTIADGYIDLQISGEQSSNSAAVIKAYFEDDPNKPLSCKNSKIFINDISAGQKTKLSFLLDFTEYCSLEVNVCGYKV